MALPIMVMRRAAMPLLIALAFLTCAPERARESKTAAKPLRIARYYWPGEYWVDIAAARGWFAEEGLQVELIDTNSDYYGGLKAVTTGSIDVNVFYVFDLAWFRAQGSDLVAFLTPDVDAGASGIVVKREVGDLRGLRGLKIAVPRRTFYEYLLNAALEPQGLTLGDVEVVDARGEEALASLAKPEIKGVVTWEPLLSKAVKQGHVRAFDTAGLLGVAPMVYATRREVLRSRAGDVRALCRVWLKTTNFISRDPQAAFAIVARIYGKTPQEVAEFARRDRIRKLADNAAAFTYGPGFESLYGAAESVNRYFVDAGMLEKPLDTATLFDDRWIRQLQKEAPSQ